MKKIIPCLDVKNGRVVKGVKFLELQDVENPVSLAKLYCERGADELAFYDITASIENRGIFIDVVREVSKIVNVPFTVGGGIASLEDARQVIDAGADKVSINSSAIKDKNLIKAIASEFGTEKVVLSVDAKKIGEGNYEVYTSGGQVETGMELFAWLKEAVKLGAGEIVLNSIDNDGVKQGYDLELVNLACEAVKVPVVASGGAGKQEDFLELFNKTDAQAGLAASIFHFGNVDIAELKKYLADNGIDVRR